MENLREQFLLNPDITFLNFGSFGATPKPIFDAYQKWQMVLEAEPVQFIAFDGVHYLADTRAALAKFIGCPDKDDIIMVTNPSFAVNLIAKNFPLQAGDEILATDIEYGACDRTWEFYCQKNKAIYRKQKINLPITTKEKFIEDFFEGVRPSTKAIFISHITSATGLIFPVKEICAIAKSKGLVTIVDGAHAPAPHAAECPPPRVGPCRWRDASTAASPMAALLTERGDDVPSGRSFTSERGG